MYVAPLAQDLLARTDLQIQYYDYFQQVQANQPSFMPEFQGGSFNPWGGPQGGCPENIGPDFANIFYRYVSFCSQKLLSFLSILG